MKWATVVVLLLLAVPSVAQFPDSSSSTGPSMMGASPAGPSRTGAADPADTVSIRGTISGLQAGTMCSAELRSPFSDFPVQRALCDPAGFQFMNVPRGTYVVVVQVGMKQFQRQVAADMPNTEVNVRVLEAQPQSPGSSPTVSLAELMIPKKARNLYDKASELLQKSKLDEAQEKLNKALAIAPKYARALALEAVISAQNNNLPQAMTNADRAVALQPDMPFAHFVRASVLNATGKYKEASVAARRGLRIDRASWQGHFELAHAMYGMGNLSKAMSEVERADSAAPKGFHDVQVLKAMILIKANLTDQARQVVKDLKKNDKDDPRVQKLDALLERTQLAEK